MFWSTLFDRDTIGFQLCHARASTEITQQLFLSTPSAGKATTTMLYLSYSCLAPRLVTCSSSHRGCFPRTPHPRLFSLVPSVSRPRSHRVHLCGPTSPFAPQRCTRLHQHRSVKARPSSLEPKRGLTNNSASAASSVSVFAPCPRISLLVSEFGSA